jgi:hypothetical protein
LAVVWVAREKMPATREEEQAVLRGSRVGSLDKADQVAIPWGMVRHRFGSLFIVTGCLSVGSGCGSNEATSADAVAGGGSSALSSGGSAGLGGTAGLPSVEATLEAGEYGSCRLFEDGRVKCWGANSYGLLGLGDTENRGDEPSEMGLALPFVDLGGDVVVSLKLGFGHACALLRSGVVRGNSRRNGSVCLPALCGGKGQMLGAQR